MQGASEADLQMALLVHGPKGSGKTTAVQAAAAALGLHLVPFNCHELKTQDGTAAGAALKAAFGSAQEYAPSILLLEQLDALAGGYSESGAQAGESCICSQDSARCSTQLPEDWNATLY